MIKYSIPWWKTSLGKEEAQRIEKAVLSRCITQGPLTEKLEKKIAELLDVPYVVLTINGSAALLMALAACDIKPQDEVVVPNFTFIATAQAPLFLGAKIKLVDVEQTRPVIDIKEIRKSITKKTKVIIPVHVNGRSADMNLINKIAAEHNLRVIEDSVQSLCSQNEFGYLGTQSDIGVFSLGITKFITAGMGGFLVTRNKKLFNKLRKIRNHGISSCKKFSFHYDMLGFNFKFSDILAGIGLSQVKKINNKIKSHKKIYNLYKSHLRSIKYMKIIKVDIKRGELPLWIEVLCAEREKVIFLLQKKGIQAKPFYPTLDEADYLKCKGNFKKSKIYAKYGLTLPCGPDQSLKDLESTIQVLKEIKAKIKTDIRKEIKDIG